MLLVRYSRVSNDAVDKDDPFYTPPPVVLKHRAAASNCYIPNPGPHNASPGPYVASPGPASNIKGVGISAPGHSHGTAGKGMFVCVCNNLS